MKEILDQVQDDVRQPYRNPVDNTHPYRLPATTARRRAVMLNLFQHPIWTEALT